VDRTANTEIIETIGIVGCGRWLRCDDQAGLLTVRMLRQIGLPAARFVLTESPAADLCNCLDGLSLLILVDAAGSSQGRHPGTWTRIRFLEEPDRLKHRGGGDSHSLSVDFALDLAQAMGLLPPEVWIYAIVADECGYGEQVTPAVGRAIRALARRIPRDIRAWCAEREAVHA
jgi:hydrogenase maturation protease